MSPEQEPHPPLPGPFTRRTGGCSDAPGDPMDAPTGQSSPGIYDLREMLRRYQQELPEEGGPTGPGDARTSLAYGAAAYRAYGGAIDADLEERARRAAEAPQATSPDEPAQPDTRPSRTATPPQPRPRWEARQKERGMQRRNRILTMAAAAGIAIVSVAAYNTTKDAGASEIDIAAGADMAHQHPMAIPLRTGEQEAPKELTITEHVTMTLGSSAVNAAGTETVKKFANEVASKTTGNNPEYDLKEVNITGIAGSDSQILGDGALLNTDMKKDPLDGQIARDRANTGVAAVESAFAPTSLNIGPIVHSTSEIQAPTPPEVDILQKEAKEQGSKSVISLIRAADAGSPTTYTSPIAELIIGHIQYTRGFNATATLVRHDTSTSAHAPAPSETASNSPSSPTNTTTSPAQTRHVALGRIQSRPQPKGRFDSVIVMPKPRAA